MADTTVLAIEHIVKTPGICGGAARIAGTRITVDFLVARLVYAGQTVGGLVADFADIPLSEAQVYAAMSYYYDHRAEIDALIEEDDRQARQALSDSDEPDDFVTSQQAAAMLGVSHESRWISQLCRNGKLDCRKFANRWMISRRSLHAYLADSPGPGRSARNSVT